MLESTNLTTDEVYDNIDTYSKVFLNTDVSEYASEYAKAFKDKIKQ
jgi:hypothetical protein